MWHGLEFLASYTLAKGTTNNRGFYGVFGGTGQQGVVSATEGAYWQNTYDPDAEWGPMFHDVRHNFILSGTYELPWGKGRTRGSDWSGAKNAFLGGWRVGGIFQARTGLPVTVIDGRNRSLQGELMAILDEASRELTMEDLAAVAARLGLRTPAESQATRLEGRTRSDGLHSHFAGGRLPVQWRAGSPRGESSPIARVAHVVLQAPSLGQRHAARQTSDREALVRGDLAGAGLQQAAHRDCQRQREHQSHRVDAHQQGGSGADPLPALRERTHT